MSADRHETVTLIMVALLCRACHGWGTVTDIQCARLALSLQPVPLCSQVDRRAYKVVCDMSTQEPEFKCTEQHCKHLSSTCVPQMCEEVGYARCWPEMTGYWRCGCTPTAFSTDSNAQLNITASCLEAELFPANTTREQLGATLKLNGTREGPGIVAGAMETCPLGTIVREISVKYDSCFMDLVTDGTAVNGVALQCEDTVTRAEKGYVTSTVMLRGIWQFPIRCPQGSINGMRIKTEYINVADYYGERDSLGVTNIEVSCEGGLVYGLGNTFLGDCATMGDWQPWEHCQDGYAVCGLKTWAQEQQGLGLGDEEVPMDDSAITDIELSCCPVFKSTAAETMELDD